MDISQCPFCLQNFPSSEIQRHANSHFEDDEQQQQIARDLELAQQLARSPKSPEGQMEGEFPIELGFGKTSNAGGSCSDGECSIHEKMASLVSLQTRSIFHRVEGGLMVLMRKCLESEAENTTSILSGYVDHFQSIQSEDVGWGCGWRNVQMLSSHLLYQCLEARHVLFGGSVFVPDIPSLQRWLEIAWERGFDVPGAEHFNHKIYGTKKWIGTTECATLFRCFGIRAMIVDFGPKELKPHYLSIPGSSLGEEVDRVYNGGKRKGIQVRGPMDQYVLRKNHDVLQKSSNVIEKPTHYCFQHSDSMGFKNNSTKKSEGLQVLIDWMWNYFSDKISFKSDTCRVIVSEKVPLYFQHDGHSRTVVGIQVKRQQNGIQQHNLLILDPAHISMLKYFSFNIQGTVMALLLFTLRTETLERSLTQNVGWEKLIKRGLCTLKKPQYQLCYVEPGIATGEDMEKLKTLRSAFFEL